MSFTALTDETRDGFVYRVRVYPRGNQGRTCTCAPDSPTVSLIAAVVWGVAFVALCAVLLGVAV